MISFDEEYLQTQLFSVSVWFKESFLQDEVSVKMGPKIKKQRNSIMLAKQDEKCTNRGNYTVDWGKSVRKHQSTSRFVNAILQVYSNSFVWSTCVQPRPLGFSPKKNGGAEKGPPFAPFPFFLGKALGTRLTCVTKKKNLTTKLQTLIKGEAISSACAWQVCWTVVNSHAHDFAWTAQELLGVYEFNID